MDKFVNEWIQCINEWLGPGASSWGRWAVSPDLSSPSGVGRGPKIWNF